MARYIKNFQVNTAPEIVHASIAQHLQSEGYEYIQYEGENVYKKGNGIMANPTFFKFVYLGNTVRLETWMKYAFFPGVYVGELGVDGFVGCAMKGPWKKRIKNLENILFNFGVRTPDSSPVSVQNTTKDVVSNAPVFCTECGNQIPKGAQFCSVCGQKSTDTVSHINNTQFQNTNNQTIAQQKVYEGPSGVQLPPSGQAVNKKDFIKYYVQPSLRKNITSIAILCYVCAGITFLFACLANPLGIIDALLLAGFALGMQLTKSKGFAIAIFVLSIIECIVGLASGSFPFWWLAAGISALITFNKIEKQYKQFLNR